MSESAQVTNSASNTTLGDLLKAIKSIPRVTAAATVYGLSYIPAQAGFMSFGNDSIDQIIGTRTPSLAEYSGDFLLIPLGLYGTLLLQGPAFRAFARIAGTSALGEEGRRSIEELGSGADDVRKVVNKYIRQSATGLANQARQTPTRAINQIKQWYANRHGHS